MKIDWEAIHDWNSYHKYLHSLDVVQKEKMGAYLHILL